MNDSSKDGVITLGGREFKRVKNGVDEVQIGAFVDELIRERDELAQSQHHIASLTKLAETTIVEADRLAKQIKAEASEQATAESAAIIDKAKEEAQHLAEKKQAEVLETAKREADAMRAEAEKKAAVLLENERRKIWDELHNVVNQQFEYLVEKLESLKQQAAAAQVDLKNKMSQPVKETSAGTAESEEESSAVPLGIEQENSGARMELEKEVGTGVVEEDNMFYESLVPMEAADRSEDSFDLTKLLQVEDQAEPGEAQFEVEILPPVHMAKIMEVVAHLDQLPEVGNTEIIPRMDMPSILVFLREEMDLVGMLRRIPAVAHVEEASIDADAANGEPGKAPKKIRIGFSGSAMSQERK
jgi:vacuolar-type H+-ATPase subunit E/Vma4